MPVMGVDLYPVDLTEPIKWGQCWIRARGKKEKIIIIKIPAKEIIFSSSLTTFIKRDSEAFQRSYLSGRITEKV